MVGLYSVSSEVSCDRALSNLITIDNVFKLFLSSFVKYML